MLTIKSFFAAIQKVFWPVIGYVLHLKSIKLEIAMTSMRLDNIWYSRRKVAEK
jgi:hypothetical protein